MDIINKIGQRKISKLLVLLATAFAILGFFINETTSILSIKTIIGVLIFIAPNIVFSFAAHNSKEHRFLAIFISFLLIIINTSLFLMKALDFMFFMLLAQIILGVGFLFFIAAAKKNQKKSERMIRVHTKQQEKARAARPKIDEELDEEKTKIEE